MNGGTLTFANYSDVVSFNVNTAEGATFTDQMVMDRVWPQTFLVNPQYNPVLDPSFVNSAELVNTNPQTIVYKIDPRAVWSDGVPITAADFIYNWRAQSGTGTDVNGVPYDVASTKGYSDIKSVTGSNNCKTVTVVFSQPFADWESLFDNLVPAHIAEKVGWNDGFDTFNPAVVISGGPFMVTSYSPGSELVLSRNPRYWGTPPRLDHIVFRLIPSPDQDPVALENGEVSLVYPPAQVNLVHQTKLIPGVEWDTGRALSYEHLDFNQASGLLSDETLRKAIALSIDRKELVKETVDQIEPSVRPDGNHIFVNNQLGYQDNASGYEHADVAQARRMLEGDGYTLGSAGYFTKYGRTLELRMTTTAGDPLRVHVEDVIRADLKSAGIKVDVANESPDALVGDLAAGRYQLALYGSTLSPFPSYTAAMFQTPSEIGGTGKQNWTAFSDHSVDALFEQASQQLDPPRAEATYNQIDRILWSKMISLPLFQDPTFIAYSNQFANIGDNGSSVGPFWDAELWGLKAAGT